MALLSAERDPHRKSGGTANLARVSTLAAVFSV
eukprot:COSAG02_NODE_29282_length_572_cov_1.084567_1_plen_32_part_10